MSRVSWVVPVLLSCCFCSPPLLSAAADEKKPLPAASLADQLGAVMDQTRYRHARWGVLVVDAETNKTLYERNADQLFAPASVTKLFSCAAALAALGADARQETLVYGRGDDLILKASGDPTLGGRTDPKGKAAAFADDDHIYASASKLTTRLPAGVDPLAGLKDLARQVKASGVNKVAGDVLIDARLFNEERGSGSGPKILTPIVVNDNVVDVIVRPGAKAGQPAKYELSPATDFLQIDVRVDTAEKGARTSIVTQRVGPGKFTVRGQIALGVAPQPQVRICVVDDPIGFARALFIDCLRREGVQVSASALRAPTASLPESYEKLTPAATHRSAPLADVLTVTLKVSHNLYASLLPLHLAVKAGKKSLADGMRQQGRTLKGLGVDVGGISLESGAGGGDGDKVSPRATVQLLQAMRKRKDWPVFEAALPILGVDGTLADVVDKDSPARGKVRGKTGTYGDANLLLGRTHLRAKSLAGVMSTAGGKTLVFCIFVNDVALPAGATPAREGRTIGKLCEILYREAPAAAAAATGAATR